MKVLVIDVEASLDGHPFNPDHRLCLLGLYDGDVFHQYDIEHSQHPYSGNLRMAQMAIDGADVLVAFNSKYDLHWLRRYGLKFQHKKLWCLQYAEFCLSGQTGWPKEYPDLHTACIRRGLAGKSDYIKETYWSKGIETVNIPWQELVDYNKQDLKIEWDLFQAQIEELKKKPQLKKLIWYGSQDLLVTEEMEWNGIKFDTALSLSIGDELLKEISGVERRLADMVGSDRVLWSSPAAVSAVLYGGVVKYDVKEPYIFKYKDGREKEKTRTVEKLIHFNRIVEPLKNSQSKKEGQWATDEGTLKKLKATGRAADLIELLLKKRELEKRVGTYYHGFPRIMEENKWEHSLLHGSLSHCRAASGRLSSKAPNTQNLEYGMRKCVITRFPLTMTN